ncbi:MAG: UPF0175 family protein [Candidatus Heimdallarchaeota archaeon]
MPMSDKITVNLPHELIELSGLDESRLEAKSLLIWVLELYSEGKLTLSKAAQLVGMKIDNFLEEFHSRRLKRKGEPQSPKEAENDFKVAQKLSQGS